MAIPVIGVPQATSPLVEQTGGITHAWYLFFLNLWKRTSGGLTGSVPLAKLTGGGTQGSITYTNGLITAVVPPT